MAPYTAQVRPVVMPAVLAGQRNGELDDAVLRPVYAPDGVTVVGRLVIPAARAYNAMVRAAAADGIDLRPTSSADTYRPLAVQQAIFDSRYDPGGTGGGCKSCIGYGYQCKKSSLLATAACPGTSNHGWALAVDIASVTAGGRLAWLEAHAFDYGFSWEVVPEEPWHVRYVAGDNPPPAVTEEDDMPTAQEVAAAVRADLLDDIQNAIKEATGYDWDPAVPRVNVLQYVNQRANDVQVAAETAAAVIRDQIITALDPGNLAAKIAAELPGNVDAAMVEAALRKVLLDAGTP